MSKFSLVTIRPQGFAHSNGFRELQESLGWALAALGHQPNVTENTFSQDDPNIVFGSELLSKDQEFPSKTCLYNLEQDSHPSFRTILTLGAKASAVWEYSKVNMPHWEKAGVKAVHVPFGFTPNLARIPKAYNQDIDVFFSGWLTERREKILTALRGRGLHVVGVDSCYGGGRDNLISRAKLCLNINHDGRNRTNIQRLSFWMANSKCIVSETSSDMHDYDDLLPSIVVERYDGLVEMCLNLLDHGRIDEMGHDALEAIKKRDYVSTVAKALESQPAPNPILERYERGCREGDMKEYLPWLRKNAAGRVLEIGVRDGASTSALLLGVEANGGHVFSLDVNDCSSLWSHRQWTFRQVDSQKVDYVGDLDMALIDGDHSKSGFLSDLNLCWKHVKVGGMIACHDTSPPTTFEDFGEDWPSVAVGQEFAKFVKEKGLTHFYLPGVQGMGVLVVKK